MARRLGSLTPRRVEDSSEETVDRSDSNSPRSKSQPYPYLTFCLVLTMMVCVIFFGMRKSGFHQIHLEKPKKIERKAFVAVEQESHLGAGANLEDILSDSFWLKGADIDLSSRPQCRAKICDALPILQEVYGKILHRTLHIGPGTCGVVSKLLKEDDVEVWGIQPYDMKEPIHPLCENFVSKGIIRVSDLYNPLPYRQRSFSLVLVTGTLDQMKPKELNQALTDLASLTSHSLMLVVGNGVQRESSKNSLGMSQKPLKPRSRIWWERRLAMVGLKEDEEHTRRFADLQSERSYKTTSNIFHIQVPSARIDF